MARSAGLAAALAVVAAAPAPAAAGVAAGYDLFVTDPATTSFSFAGLPIPADFFDPGSAPFTGKVQLAGKPLETFGGHAVGDADTVVQRAPSTGATVPIELVALSLVSVKPIKVKIGADTQEWDVEATLSTHRPSQGVMEITKTTPNGGTFNSQLVVFPLFIFTRGNTTLTLDVGQQFPPSADVTPLKLHANGVWRAGCIYPALAVPGLNDGFCPGLTPAGEKQLTVEEALLAQHGVYPAQPLPDHFKCYDVRPPKRFTRRTVQLTDQFGLVSATVLKPRTLCNPVQKNAERIQNTAAHLKCYGISVQPGFTSREVLVRNQFGDQSLTVVKPETLCVPSTKTVLKGPARKLPRGSPGQLPDHFECYRVTGSVERRTVRLADQFHVERVRVLRPVQLCTPARKNAEPLLHPLQHLTCYEIEDVRSRPFVSRVVRVKNQFGTEILTVRGPRTLCVPSQKFLVEKPPPPPPPPCTGELTATGQLEYRFQFTCDLAGVDGFALVVPAQIVTFQSPPGLSCALHTTSSLNDTLICTGAISQNAEVEGELKTSQPISPGQGGQLYPNQGQVQQGPYALSGP